MQDELVLLVSLRVVCIVRLVEGTFKLSNTKIKKR